MYTIFELKNTQGASHFILFCRKTKFVETLQNDSQTMSSQASNVRQPALLEV
jgi:hypothetical protein